MKSSALASVLLCSMFGEFSTALAAPYAYVPIREHDQVLVIDTATNALVETFTAGDSPEAALIVGQRDLIYVSNSGDNTVSIISMVTHEVVGTIATNGELPNVLISDPTGTRVYVETIVFVPGGHVGMVEVIDTISNSIVETFTIPGLAPVNLAIDPTGRFLYVVGDIGTSPSAHQLSILDLATKSLIAQIPLDIGDGIDRQSGDFVINPIGGNTVYVAHSDEIVIVDTSTHSIIGRLIAPAEAEVQYLAINPTGSRLYATIFDDLDSIVWIIDTSTNTIIDQIHWESLYPGDSGDAYRFVRPQQIETDAAGALLYVVTNNPAELVVVDATAHSLVGKIPFGFSGVSFLGSLWEFVDHPDSDGDGLLDTWESAGIDYDGGGFFDFSIPDADPNHKDVYVEADWMQFHKPNADAIEDVIDVFAAVPPHLARNPDGNPGVNLHVDVGEEAVLHNDLFTFASVVGPVSGVPDFDMVKSASFGTPAERSAINSANILAAKRLVYRYALYVHDQFGSAGSSGRGEVPGNDFVISLGSWESVDEHPVGNVSQQSGTFMHELGHTLGLHHGGDDRVNCKPNYLSVMNYAFQMDDFWVENRPLNYSEFELPTLDESDLNEVAGLGGVAGVFSAYGPPPVLTSPADTPIDWNRDGDTADINVMMDINNFGLFTGCSGAGTTLEGFNDWQALVYNFRTTPGFSGGVEADNVEMEEFTFEQAFRMSPDTDGDGLKNLVDNCPFEPNQDQLDGDGDGVGNACEDFLVVGIDVKPESAENKINLRSNGVVPVAVFSSMSFDAGTILAESVSVSGASVKLTGKGKHYLCSDEDVNYDGLSDLLCHVYTAAFLLEEGQSTVVLEGMTAGGERIRGEDTVQIVP